MPEQPTSPATTPILTEREAITNVIREKMREWWDEICRDAGAHPSDMVHGRGSVLFYEPNHWTDAVANFSADAILSHRLTTEGGLLDRAREMWAVEMENSDGLAKDSIAIDIRARTLDETPAMLAIVKALASSPPSSEAGLREALDELQRAEEVYRNAHDLYGDGSPNAGRAWVLMRRAGEKARSALASSPPSSEANDTTDGTWTTVTADRAMYVDRGVNVILCDRLPNGPVTLLLKNATPSAVLDENGRNAVLEELEAHFRSCANIARHTLDCNADDVRKLEESADFVSRYRKERT